MYTQGKSGRKKHRVLRRQDAASHGAVNPIKQDDAIHLPLEGGFCVYVDLGEGHSEMFLEAQGSQMFSCTEGRLRKLLSGRALAILQNQTAELCPLQCHLLWGRLSTSSVSFSLLGLEPLLEEGLVTWL